MSTQTAQDIAQTVANQVARQPLEILKDAATQLTGTESVNPQETNTEINPDSPQANTENSQAKLQDKAFTERRIQALESEIKDIEKQNIFGGLQARITQGEAVPLEDYTELSMDQKQVLKAQMEAVKNQRAQASYQASLQEVPTIHSKPSRRFGAGQKMEAEKQ